MPAEIVDVAPGLWLWRLSHPGWKPGLEWEPPVTSTCVESAGEVALLDPLAPPDDGDEVWARLDASPPTLVAILKPDHVRSVDLMVERYGVRAFGPWLFWPDDVPETRLEGVDPGTELPALRALLELPFERVIISHGEPVHDRAAFERALEVRPWGAIE
jgi:hypothetical protein